jgi:hypothetical protein
MGPDPSRERDLPRFEQEAEMLAVYQLDLLAQLERQLRAVHQTMRQIEKLRNPRHRRHPVRDISNGDRFSSLTTLSDELTSIDRELHTQHQSCQDMQHTIDHMLAMLARWRAAGQRLNRAERNDAERPG